MLSNGRVTGIRRWYRQFSFGVADRVPELEHAVGTGDHADVFPELVLHGGHGIVDEPLMGMIPEASSGRLSRKRVHSSRGAR